MDDEERPSARASLGSGGGTGAATRPSWKNVSIWSALTSNSRAPDSTRSASARWFSYVSATIPSASARMRRFVSIVTKTVGRPPSSSRTSNAVWRMALSIALLSMADGSSGVRGGTATRSMPPDLSGTPLERAPPASRRSSSNRTT